MRVVGRESDVEIAVGVEVLLRDARGVAEDRLRDRHVVDDVVVGVGQVAGRRHEQQDVRRRGAARRQHEERDGVLGLVEHEAHARRRRSAGRRAPRRRSRSPAAVVEVVVVEVDRAVEPGRVAVALLAAVPVPARHAAHRLVARRSPRGRCRRRRRCDRSRRRAARCRPRSPSARAGRARAGRRRPRARRARPRRARARTAWASRSCRCSAPRPPCPDRRGRPRTRRRAIVNGVPASRFRRHRRAHASPLGDRHHRREQAVVGVAHRLLVDRRLAAGGVVGAGDRVPARGPERHVGAHRGIADVQRQPPALDGSARSRRRSRPSAGRGSAGRPCRASSGRRTRAASAARSVRALRPRPGRSRASRMRPAGCGPCRSRRSRSRSPPPCSRGRRGSCRRGSGARGRRGSSRARRRRP